VTLPRVVILGGGVGSVVSALQLSKPGWQTNYASITLHQQGWRLGGKGASGRGQNDRIEEHGLHIWFGFYENAFKILRSCHDELDELAQAGTPRWSSTMTSMEQSFRACSDITLTDHDGCCWSQWSADFFHTDDDLPWAEPDPRMPGERPEDWSAVFYAARALRLAADALASLPDPTAPATSSAKIVAGGASTATATTVGVEYLARTLWNALGQGPQSALTAAADLLDAVVEDTTRQSWLLDGVDLVLRAVDLALDTLRGRADALVHEHDALRRAWYVADLMLAIARGLIEDDVLAQDSFAVIDDTEFSDWLRSHGATRETVGCALVRCVVYDLAFAYRDGDPQRPAAGAGTALRGLLRAFFTYRGSMMWKMNAGMGDVVFAPMYELLVKRGVDVRFFDRVEALRVKSGLVEEIEIDHQAALAPGVKAKDFVLGPSVSTAAAPAMRWPASPTVPLQQSTKTAALPPPVARDFESYLAGRAVAREGTTVLRRGAAVDGFEVVVYGLPIATIPLICPDLVAQSPRWKAAVDHVKTVPTQAMQLWLNVPATALGDWEDGCLVGGYTEPYDTWADMSHLVSQEAVAGSQTVAYFCNVLHDAPLPARGQATAWLDEQDLLVRHQAERFLRHDIKHLWPAAIDPATNAFDWNLLVAPPSAVGEARLDAQYVRANVEPSERYTLSVPGSSKHRLHPGATGFANLVVAGDWTACHLDAGCVEAAAISGMLAANAIHETYGDPAQSDPIIGYESP